MLRVKGRESLADYSQVDTLGSRYKFVNFGAEKVPAPPIVDDSRVDVTWTLGLTDFSQVDSPGVRYKSVNLKGRAAPDPPQRASQ